MTRSAEQYSRGDFSQRLMMQKSTASYEIATLAEAMDRMADQLDDKINTIINQRNQLETVFSSMVEAVFTVDGKEQLISMNTAAATRFGIDRRQVKGRLVQEVIRNVSLHRQITHVLETEESLEEELVLTDTAGGKTYLQAHTVSLYDGNGTSIGALVVLNDVTRLRRLEKIRSDFVANVSHELRTPITSIRGYVETLLDGAIDDREHAEKFLEIVLRQSEQLSDIIDDLLILSRIEQDVKGGDVRLHYGELRPLLESTVETCTHKAVDRNITVELDCAEDIGLKMNRTLLEQAVVNLVVNGITYSEPGGTVTIRGEKLQKDGVEEVVIRVCDTGIGISREHLPRLFERFYRSDKARSRKIGGTGLGLAIVKHIVQAHGGAVGVKSTPGKGSEFSISIPA